MPIIEECQRLRGWIANGYAQIEYFLGDLIVRSFDIPEYSQFSNTLPHDATRRIKRVRQLIEHDGFFSEFRGTIEEIVNEFEKYNQTRNLLAHGFCEFLYTSDGDCGVRFSKWHREPDRQNARLQRTFRVSDLEAEMDRITILSSKSVKVFFEVHKRLGLVEE